MPERGTVAGTLFLTDEDVAASADWPAAIDALRRAYAAEVDPKSVPPRSMARGPGVWLRGLTAISPLGGHLGCKLIAASLRAHRASYLLALFDPSTTALVALIDANQITGIRTAATAAVAVDALAPVRALQVGILGSGFEARAQISALAASRDIAACRIFSPTAHKRESLAEHCRRALHLRAEAVATPQAALADADVAICAARAVNEVPVLRAEWLAVGTSVVSIGSTLPEQREVDVNVIERAALIVADVPDEVAHDSGDMLEATRLGIGFADKLASLSDIVGRRRGARASPQDIVLYKSVGSALQDVVIAELLLSRAQARGLGTHMPVSIVPVAK